MLDKLLEIWPILCAVVAVVTFMWGWSLKLLYRVVSDTTAIQETLRLHSGKHMSHESGLGQANQRIDTLLERAHRAEIRLAILEAHDPTHIPSKD